jgi:hypothetical protein
VRIYAWLPESSICGQPSMSGSSAVYCDAPRFVIGH